MHRAQAKQLRIFWVISVTALCTGAIAALPARALAQSRKPEHVINLEVTREHAYRVGHLVAFGHNNSGASRHKKNSPESKRLAELAKERPTEVLRLARYVAPMQLTYLVIHDFLTFGLVEPSAAQNVQRRLNKVYAGKSPDSIRSDLISWVEGDSVPAVQIVRTHLYERPKVVRTYAGMISDEPTRALVMNALWRGVKEAWTRLERRWG